MLNWMNMLNKTLHRGCARLPAITTALLMVLLSAPVFAYDPAQWLADLSGSDAAVIVEKKTGGKVLKVSEEERKGEWVYRVKVLLPEGRVKTVFISKASGAVKGG